MESSFGFDDLLKGLGGDDNCDMTDSSTLLIIPSAASASNEGDHDAANTTDAVKETMAPSSSGRHLHRRKVTIIITCRQFLNDRFSLIVFSLSKTKRSHLLMQLK